jgi:hypothetical protein
MSQLFVDLPSDTGAQADTADAARAVLRYVVDRMTATEPADAAQADPSRCPNCGRPTASTRTPYCSEPCREIAGFVRQFRTGISEGWIEMPEKQVALGQVLWHILGGGRPLRRALVPAKAVEAVIKREGGLCQACSAPATTIDHLGSACNRTINLRAVCEACCRDRRFGDPAVLTAPGVEALLTELAGRIASPHPLRVCDDAATWDWRDYVDLRRAGASHAPRLGGDRARRY